MLLVLGLAAVLGGAPSAHAICDVIPGPTNQFRAAVGAADRPFAGPGEFVDVKIRPQVCDRASLGLKDVTTPSGIGAEDVAVTVIFTPPSNGPRHAVVTATDCARFASSVCVGGLSAGNLCTNDLQCLGGSCTGASKLSACQAQLGPGGVASCVTATGPDLAVTSSATEGHVRFRFPDTDALVGTASDDRTLAGPATIAVSPPTAALPCGLASQRCAVAGGTIACVDELYAIDGTCSTQTAALDETFQHFTALPPPNNYEAVCNTPGTPCDGTATEVRFTTDASGNVLIPMDYRGVLVRLDDVPVPRLVRGETNVDAFSGPPLTPVAIPDAPNFLSSYSPQGRKVPPLFTPLADPNAPASLTLFGSIDAPLGVIRIARKGPGTLTCSGGANAGNACTSDAQCPAADCALFEFRDRYEVGVGPVVLPDTLYAVGAENPVPIDGLNETADLFAFVRSEALTNEDLNGDGDQTDAVLTLRDRHTGLALPVGTANSPGRAATRVHQPKFSFPAVATGGDIVAFLESEPLEGNGDLNSDGDVFDSILRVYRTREDCGGGTPCAQELTTGPALAIDAAPLVEAQSVAISNGFVFYRVPEWVNAPQQTKQVSVSSSGIAGNATSFFPRISDDASTVVFSSQATNLVPFDSNGAHDVFAHDRSTGVTERTSVASNGAQGNDGTFRFDVSSDGRLVLMEAGASNFAPNDLNGFGDLFVRDRSAGTTSLVLTLSQPTNAGYGLELTGDRFVAFASDSAFDLFPQDTNQRPDVFVLDLTTGTTTLESVNSLGLPSEGESSGPDASADGRFLVFSNDGPQMIASEPLLTGPHVYLRDRITGDVTLVDRNQQGEVGDSNPGTVRITLDGETLVFGSSARNLVAGDTNNMADSFVRDRRSGRIRRINVGSDGTQANNLSADVSVSPDGRFIGFLSRASNLVPNDTNNTNDVFVHDLVTASTQRVSVSSSGAQANAGSFGPPSLSADGRFVAFNSVATNLSTFATNTFQDAFLRGPSENVSATLLAFDASQDGDLADTVLRVLDTNVDPPAVYGFVGVADKVAVAGSMAAFLSRENAVGAGTDCNGDGDVLDTCVVQHLAPSNVATYSLGRAASDVALSTTYLAVATPEGSQGGQDLNGDGDTLDAVLAVRSATDPGSAPSGWVNVGRSVAGPIAIVGSRVAFLTAEVDQGGADLNGDGDAGDRVLQVYDAASATLTNTGQATEDFVLGESMVAMRTSEFSQGLSDLNGDGDSYDAVLAVYDFLADRLLTSSLAAVPCEVEACDPRVPYRVAARTVTFLTLEAQQGGQDLNADGDSTDVLLQVFNAARAAGATSSMPAAVSLLAGVSAGVCTTSGLACATDAECGGGSCFVPPGVCIADLGGWCSPGGNECGPGRFCRASSCRQAQGPCKEATDCTGNAACEETSQTLQSLIAPLTDLAADDFEVGAQALPSDGTCVETIGGSCVTSSDCTGGGFCESGTCARQYGDCEVDPDCPVGTCRHDLTTSIAADVDGDALADPIDNCPTYPNAAQADFDEDGIGDACDAQTCGNGIREGNPATMSGVEECDDGNRTPGDGCDATCQRESTDCADGFDNDGDGKTDYGTGPTNDPSCQNELGFASESPQCDDGKDNDGDGLVDWPAETKCQNRFDNDELTDPATGCGLLGVEPLVIAAIARALASRRRRRCIA